MTVNASKTKQLKAWLDALVLMRIPFSVYLMPIFWLAASQVEPLNFGRTLLCFAVLHLLIYPASNGYNSYHDKDTGPVGGLASPPKVSQELLFLIILFDILTIIASYFLGWIFLSWVVAYVLASKAYSWPAIRLKADPILGTAIVVVLQGAGTYYMVLAGLGICACEYGNAEHILYGLGATITLLGNYPLTQIYQHEEDALRGDETLSQHLGVEGTFRWAMGFTGLGGVIIGTLLFLDFGWIAPLLLLIFQLPAQIHLMQWYLASKKDSAAVNHKNAMRMNQLASLGFSAALIGLLVVERFW
jgi:1,4-dihydroxy-2-naphthoate octaprenyltransferase